MSHDAEELRLADFTIAIFVELVNHGLQLIVRQIFTKFAGNTSQVTQTNLICVVLIEELERLEDLLDRVSLRDFSGHDLEELGVLNLLGAVAIILVHEALHLLLLNIEAERAHGYLQLMVVNLAGFVSVEQVERLLDLLLLLVSQLGAATALPNVSRVHAFV